MVDTTSQTQWHILDFYTDDEGSSALTIFVEGTRFHIIADINKLAKDAEAGAEYHELLADLRAVEKGERPLNRSTSNGGSSDSGVDVRERPSDDEGDANDNPEGTLQNWMVEPLAETLAQITKESSSSAQSTLQEWYHGPTRFCELAPSEDGTELEALELDSVPDLEDRLEKMLPNMTLPKYITEKLGVRCYSASDFHVIDTSDQPVGTPFHPSRVQNRKTQAIHFLKIVDNAQPGPMKREIDILNRIKQSKLYEEMNVPILEGLVLFDDERETAAGKKKIMGFIQTDIPDPTPLTLQLTTDVPQKKRDTWAKEADRVKEVLHENDIIWGDSKADNFMTDKEDNLWIIDFGGSYTEGWVDKELNETVEGDNMGMEKIVNALIDPIANTCDPDEEAQANDNRKKTGSVDELSTKRKRTDVDEDANRGGSFTTAKSSRKQD